MGGDVVEFVGAVDGHGEGDAEDFLDEEGDGGGGGGEVDVEVGELFAEEEVAGEDGFGEVEEPFGDGFGVRAAEAEGELETGEETGGMGGERAPQGAGHLHGGHAFQADGGGGFDALFFAELGDGAVRRVDGDGIDVDAEAAELADFAKDEGVGNGGVAADEVGDAEHVLGNATGGPS